MGWSKFVSDVTQLVGNKNGDIILKWDREVWDSAANCVFIVTATIRGNFSVARLEPWASLYVGIQMSELVGPDITNITF